jgi:hypothetical protein
LASQKYTIIENEIFTQKIKYELPIYYLTPCTIYSLNDIKKEFGTDSNLYLNIKNSSTKRGIKKRTGGFGILNENDIISNYNF